jgi:hypothetical protein
LYLGEKVIQMENWKEDRLRKMMMQLQHDLEEKEKALARLQVLFQENREERQPSISTIDVSTMTNTTLVISPCINIFSESF